VHYLALGLKRRRTLLTIHDCVSLERLRGLKRAVFRWFWYSLPVRRAALVSVVSESTRRELLRHVKCDPAKVRVVPNCVSSDFLRHDKPFNCSKPVVLHVGTGANKNLERAIEALAGIVCHLKIIGQLNSEQRAALGRHHVEFSNLVRATDAEVVKAYQASDLLLFASTYEGFGLPIVEANATGRPVVTSNLLSMPEVTGEAACMVDPFDVASIRAGVVRVIEGAEYRQALVAAGFENVRRFEPRTIAAQYAALYSEIASVA
jgi:glycosyltransferase involved in cell wall biosynthesis